jgi:hypothetical protein
MLSAQVEMMKKEHATLVKTKETAIADGLTDDAVEKAKNTINNPLLSRLEGFLATAEPKIAVIKKLMQTVQTAVEKLIQL